MCFIACFIKTLSSLWKAPASLQQEGCATHVCGDIRCCYSISSTTRHLSSAARAKRQTPISGFICSFNTPVPIFSHATANDNKWERWKTRDKRKHQNNKSTFYKSERGLPDFTVDDLWTVLQRGCGGMGGTVAGWAGMQVGYKSWVAPRDTPWGTPIYLIQWVELYTYSTSA